MFVVSACLTGVKCKYNGGANLHPEVVAFLQNKQWVPVCPEQFGGLPTPRVPSEITGAGGEAVLAGKAKVMTKDGQDVSDAFIKGAEETLRIALLVSATDAILKEGSPSCGSCRIYNGRFEGQCVPGAGVAAELLKKHGIRIWSEENFSQQSE